MSFKRTRNSLRTRAINQSLKTVDDESRNYVHQTKLEALESDYYESPNRLAEDNSEDDYDFDKEDQSDKGGKKKIRKKVKTIKKKNRRESYVVRNLNLKKTLKEEGLENADTGYPNFLSCKVHKPKYPKRKFCSVCGNISNYTCPRCGENYCTMRCHDVHKEIMCLRFEY